MFRRWAHPDTISHQVKKVLKEAGYGQLTTHSLRHTFASLQVMQGRNLRTVQEFLGHTEIYAYLTESHLAAAAKINLGAVRGRIDSAIMTGLDLNENLSILRNMISAEPLLVRG